MPEPNMKSWVATFAGLIAIAAPLGFAADADRKTPDPANGQKLASQSCAACHGLEGVSPIPINPNLAGQHADYILKQLRDFKANKERKNPAMMALVATLSEADMRDLAAHYAGQKPKSGAAQSKELVELGQKLYRGGNAAAGLPACAACHGPAGSGIPVQFPRIAGQHADYTAAQLKAFRSGERANDTNQMMRMIAARMTDREVAAVAQYAAGLH
jgi:cytochrome c553